MFYEVFTRYDRYRVADFMRYLRTILAFNDQLYQTLFITRDDPAAENHGEGGLHFEANSFPANCDICVPRDRIEGNNDASPAPPPADISSDNMDIDGVISIEQQQQQQQLPRNDLVAMSYNMGSAQMKCRSEIIVHFIKQLKKSVRILIYCCQVNDGEQLSAILKQGYT